MTDNIQNEGLNSALVHYSNNMQHSDQRISYIFRPNDVM